MSNLVNVLSKLVQLEGFTHGGLGAEPPAAEGFRGLGAKPPAAGQFFCNFFAIKSYFNAIGLHFAYV